MASSKSSASEKEESVAHTTDCQQYEENVQELTLSLASTSIESQKTNLPRDNEHVTLLSKFTVTQRKQILSICPVDDQAWLSILEYKGLVLVSREGEVVETVKLDFYPYRLAMVGRTDIFMTCNPYGTFIYKMSLHNKEVTEFADIKPYAARDISIYKTGEVFVSTKTPLIVVLNQSGTIVKKLDIPVYGSCIVSLSFGIAVSGSKGNYITTKVVLVDESGKDKQPWSGDLDNGQTPSKYLCKMSCDKDDRLFIPDYKNNQVYVLSKVGKLDQKHAVDKPSAVGVDTCGDVWIGCGDGTVHVMRL